ncbi:protein of unknown function [Zhouia amylolytica]|uniref:DUF4252 domain-containing protein n=2 Tax=Zhouia amylolytica TaxID=376730 RepID=W2ULZ6_9FLAO|nr:DUF4252 domain-containing protein [Zhouia amylolytica]ETN94999.1 hypothetical protein P278_21570 [Zhouia amylolytica AD3]MCQ0110587.1 DUF4252 domain-containing protein [Zhouia amylolytica]SFS64504.1 protein of unknown function [Zhouia amylolytica]
MRKLIFVFVVLIVFASCGVKTPYDTFREENQDDVVFSLGASRFLTHLFMDKDDLDEYKQIVDGVSKYRVMVFDRRAKGLNKRFDDFVSKKGYEQLFYLKDDGTLVNLYLYNRFGKTKEVIFRVHDGDDLVVISAEGKDIKIGNIQKELNKVVRN